MSEKRSFITVKRGDVLFALFLWVVLIVLIVLKYVLIAMSKIYMKFHKNK